MSIIIKGIEYQIEKKYNGNHYMLKGKEGSYINGIGYHYNLVINKNGTVYLDKVGWTPLERTRFLIKDLEFKEEV